MRNAYGFGGFAALGFLFVSVCVCVFPFLIFVLCCVCVWTLGLCPFLAVDTLICWPCAVLPRATEPLAGGSQDSLLEQRMWRRVVR